MNDVLTWLLMSEGLKSGVGFGNDISQAQALRGEQAYRSSQTGFNAAWLDYRAQDELQRGYLAAARARLQGEQLESNARVKAAAGNQDVNVGSGAVARNDQQLLADYARLDAQNEAFRRSLGLQAEAVGLRQQDRMNRLAARGAINQTYIKMAGNLASSAVGAYAAYNRYSGLGDVPSTPYAQQPSSGSFSYTPPELLNPVKPDLYDQKPSGGMLA